MGLLCGFEPDSVNEGVEIVDNALIEPVERQSVLAAELSVGADRRKKARGKRTVDALEELEKHEADRVTAGRKR